MAKEFIPRLGILPPPQRQLWPLLKDTPGYFTLYGGTAIALRLGHRQSVDFDFFSNQPFDPGVLLRTIPYLKQATVLQLEQNSLTCRVNFQGTVQLSYFGDLSLKKVAQPEIAEGPQIKVAALIDLAATKADVVQKRAQIKDYQDIDALIKAGINLGQALRAAQMIYGPQFNPQITLKALSYYGDEQLQNLSPLIRKNLEQAVRQVDLDHLPSLSPFDGPSQR